MIMGKTLASAVLAGRCANGYERGRGSVVHLVAVSERELQFGINSSFAICGKTHGRRSAGWSLSEAEATCPKCLKMRTSYTEGIEA